MDERGKKNVTRNGSLYKTNVFVFFFLFFSPVNFILEQSGVKGSV